MIRLMGMELNAKEGGDRILAKALERRARALREVQEIDAFLATYAALAGLSVEELQERGDQDAAPVTRLPEAEAAPASERRTPYAMEANDPAAGMPQREFTDLARELLLARGRPMQSHPLLAAFHEIGRRVGGKDELRNLTTKLWRAQDEITKVPGAGYWPRDVPCPAVRYTPPERPIAHQGGHGDGEPNLHHPLDELTAPMRERLGRAVDGLTVALTNASKEREAVMGEGSLDDEIPF